MRRALSMTWHGLAIVLAIVIVSLAILELHSFDIRFRHHGRAWQFACTEGVLRLGNAPQIKLEIERSEAARDVRNRINEAREMPIRQILRRETWRSQAYQVAMIKLNDLREIEADETLRAIEKENASRSPAITYAVSVFRLILIAITLLALWLAIQSFYWMRRLRRAGWTRRQLVTTGLASFSALLFLALAYLWIRTNYVTEDLKYLSRASHGAEYISTTTIAVSEGNFGIYHNEEAFLNPRFHGHFVQGSLSSLRDTRLSQMPGLRHESFWIPSRPSGGLPFWRQLRFSFISGSSSQTRFVAEPWSMPTTMWIGITVPIWPFMLPCAFFPIFWFLKSRRSIFAGANLCPGCGYDLRASPARCPECGMVRAAATRVT